MTHDVGEAVTLADRIVVIGGEPGHVCETIDVGLERPRDRSDGDFAGFHRRVHEAIRE